MPFIEPFRGQPFGGVFVLGAGGRACARRRALTRHAVATANLRNTSIRGVPPVTSYLMIPMRFMMK